MGIECSEQNEDDTLADGEDDDEDEEEEGDFDEDETDDSDDDAPCKKPAVIDAAMKRPAAMQKPAAAGATPSSEDLRVASGQASAGMSCE